MIKLLLIEIIFYLNYNYIIIWNDKNNILSIFKTFFVKHLKDLMVNKGHLYKRD